MSALSTLALLSLSAAQTAGRYGDQRRAAGAAERQGNYEGDLLDQNATMADRQAADAVARGHEGEQSTRRGMRLLSGSQRAAIGASGVMVDSGSARNVVEGDQELGELEALTIRNNAKREAWGYQVQADDYRRQGGMARTAGREKAAALRRQSTSTLLSGAGDLASIYATAPKGISRGGTVPSSRAGTPAASGYTRTGKGYSGNRRSGY